MNTRTKIALSFLMSLGVLTSGLAIGKCVTIRALFEEDYTWNITEPGILTITEHYLGIIIASMPTLKPLFSKLLGTTTSGSSQDSSRRSFQKINSGGITDSGPQSHAPSGRSSVGGDFSRRTTGFRVNSHLELEVNRDFELQNGPLPDHPRHSGNSWAHESGLTQEHNPGVPTGGRKHVDDAFQSTSLPSIPKGVRSARIQP
ncbi:MAG: hypothetical protein LQ337_000624 [Flavoplaca oasis]|nr:MAG: hypothetical protein LQ337_000624 [Flavoplaca oasis]